MLKGTRTESGSPTLADVNAVEIHQDTWDFGFTLFYDGLRFAHLSPGGLPPPGPSPPPGVNPDAISPKVLLFVYDPIMENKGGQRMHAAYGWGEPRDTGEGGRRGPAQRAVTGCSGTGSWTR